jgi:SulP family sulfate permease
MQPLERNLNAVNSATTEYYRPQKTGWMPRSVECLRGYTLRSFTSDLIAGLTVGLVALPLAMAFGIASGVAPQASLYTAVVAGFIISALGGSSTQIGGPTGAFVEFFARMKVLVERLPTVHWPTAAIAAGALVWIVAWPKVSKRIPGTAVALFASTIAVALLHLNTETVGTRFGGIPQGLPPFALPNLHAEHILLLLPSAFTVALLAAVESLLSAVVADGMSGDRLREWRTSIVKDQDLSRYIL